MLEKTTINGKEYRLESDSCGEKNIPVDAYYGVQSLRAKENFPITGQLLHPEFIRSLAAVKKACAIANCEADQMTEEIKNAIVEASDEILEGKLHDAFIVDPIQGGAGTSMNMNANEVIANRAVEILGGEKGDYSIVHPNDHVNYGQSTNDVIPTAGKLTVLRLLPALYKEFDRLYDALMMKAGEFDDVIKMGRTQMEDAIPVRLGQEFHAYAQAVKRAKGRIEAAANEMLTINMGGTAIGTGLNADKTYFSRICPVFADVTGLAFVQGDDLIDCTQNIDPFAAVSASLKTAAITLSKISNDLRLMGSGPRCGFGEIHLPAKQNGSSIMPGKVNPVIPEVMSQVCFRVIGNDVAITMAAEAGQLELNAFEPVTFYALFESITTLTGGISTLTDNCVAGLIANKEHCEELVENSVGIITAICPYVGYAKAAHVAKKALKTGDSVRKLTIEEGLLTEEELNHILQPANMTEPGIAEK